MKQSLTLDSITHLSRALDPRYPSNRIIMLGAAGAGALIGLAALLNDTALVGAASKGLWAGVAVFLAWALGRELDPDANLSAYVAGGVMFGAYVWLGAPALLPVLAIMMMARVTSRVVGMPALALDYGYVLLVLGLAVLGGQGMVAWVGVVAFLYQARLDNHRRWALGAAGVALALGVYGMTLEVDRAWDWGLLLMAGVVAMLSVPALLSVSASVRSYDDLNRAPLNGAHLRAAQGMVWGAALLVLLWAGSQGVAELAPLWAALLGVVVRWVRDSIA